MYSDFVRTRMLSGIAGLAVSVLLVPGAMAQDEASPATPAAGAVQEEVTIASPKHSPWQSTIGAPYESVSMSVPVSYRDLNLHTGDGVYTLRQRVTYTARTVCSRLTFRYPVGLPDTDGCYRRAVANAMPQADSAVWNYRSPTGM
jgi:UrcA family protein